MLLDLRRKYNESYQTENYQALLEAMALRCGTRVGFRVAETPVFLPKAMLDAMAAAGAALTHRLLGWPEYLAAARESIPAPFLVAGKSDHPNFLTADFALVEGENHTLRPKLVEIQAFPSVYGYQSVLNEAYREVFGIAETLGFYLGGLDRARFWALLRRTVLGTHAAENVVLIEVDPLHQKTLPDFLVTGRELGIHVVDIASLVPVGKKLHYRSESGALVPIHRIYNRAIADEMVVRKIELPFDLTAEWEVEWAGHPNWYFLISKYALPWLSLPSGSNEVEAWGGDAARSVVPPAEFLVDFLAGAGFERLRAAGVKLPEGDAEQTVYGDLLLKPLFSFAGKGIQFGPSRGELEAIPEAERGNYLLQQRMDFVPTVETPHGLTQAEIRILYLWPDGGELTPVISLVRLGRGKMMGVDHNRDQEWVGSSAAFWR